MYYSYLNGQILPYKDIKLHISDLLFQRGYGVFDFFRCRDGNILWLDDYIERLFNSIRLANIKIELSTQEFKSIIYELQEKNGDDNGAFKVIVSGGYSDTLDAVTSSSNILILNIPWKKPSNETFENGVKLISAEYARLDPEIKTLNYFNLLKLHKSMKEHGAVDVLYHGELISEVSRANVFFVKGQDIFTPASNILHGITRKQILKIIPGIHIEDIPLEKLYDFDEMFLSSTTRDITPIISIDGINIGNGSCGELTKEIQSVFYKEQSI